MRPNECASHRFAAEAGLAGQRHPRCVQCAVFNGLRVGNFCAPGIEPGSAQTGRDGLVLATCGSAPTMETRSCTPSQPKLLDRVRDAIRTRHYSRRTEVAYVTWIRRYIGFHRKAHPATLGAPDDADSPGRTGGWLTTKWRPTRHRSVRPCGHGARLIWRVSQTKISYGWTDPIP